MGASSSSLSCPASDGTTYTTAGQSYQIACFNDSMYSDIHPQGAASTFTLESCISLCAQTETCIDVSWIPTTNSCWTKNATNSGTHNGLVWGARLLTTSTSSELSPSTTVKPTSTSTSPSAAATTTTAAPSAPTVCSTIDRYGNIPNSAFASGLAPWVFSGPDTSSHVVQNDPHSPFTTSSYFLFNSTGQNRNTITDLVCGLNNHNNYGINVRYSFAAANAGPDVVPDDRIYGLQVSLNRTVVGEAMMSASMVAADEFYSVGGNFEAESGAYELAVSWGVVGGVAAEGNVYAVMEVTNIAFNLEEDFE